MHIQIAQKVEGVFRTFRQLQEYPQGLQDYLCATTSSKQQHQIVNA
jgi:hypothetical protein